MPYDSNGVWTRASNTTPTTNSTITVTMHEAEWEDLKTSMNKLPVKDVANTFTASPQRINSTDSGASETALQLVLYRNSSSPTAADLLSRIAFTGNDAGGNETVYAAITPLIASTTDTAEQGALGFNTAVAGSYSFRYIIQNGFYYYGGADKGAGTGNFNGLYSQASVFSHNGTAIPAGGTAGAGFLVSSTSNFGIFFGSGAPSLSAAQGSLYLRSDGSSTSTRLYVNTNGTTGWAAVTTAS